MRTLRPYVDSWHAAEDQVWVENVPFQLRNFAAYLQMYRRSTRLYLVPTAIPGQMQPPGTSEMYPIESMVGIRHHVGELTEQAQEDVAAFIHQVEIGPLLPQEEHISWLRRLQENLRGIKQAILCTRSSDVVPHRAAQRPPRHSLDIHDPRPHVSPPRHSLRCQDSRPQPRSSSWQQQQGPQQEEDWLHQQLWQSQQHMWQDTTEGQYMASPGGHTSAFSDRSSDVHSDVFGDPQAYQTPPPPLT